MGYRVPLTNITEEEKKLICDALLEKSLAGIAIIREDFTFYYVGQQFCDILNVTPAQLYDKSLRSITPEPFKSEDIANAQLVKEGRLQGYLMKKDYEMQDGRRIHLVQLIRGIFDPQRGFLFYLCSIMEEIPLVESSVTPPKGSSWLKYLGVRKILAAFGVFIAALITTVGDKILAWIK